MDTQELFLWAGCLYACHDDPALAALAYRGWRTSIRRGWVTVRVAT